MSRGVSVKTNNSNNSNYDKPKEFRTAIIKLVRYCKPYYPMMVIALLCAAIAAIFTIMGPGKLSQLTDLVSAGMKTGIDMEAITEIGLFLLTIYITGFFLNFIQGIIMTNTTQKVSRNLRSDISKKINVIPARVLS